MLAVAGNRALLIVPVVILEASRFGILAAFSVSLVILLALSSGIRTHGVHARLCRRH